MIRDYKPRNIRQTDPRSVSAAKIDVLPPHDESAEQALLSCMMQDSAGVFGEIGTKISQHSFFIVKHQILFGILKQKRDANELIDLITVQSAALSAGVYEQLGGITWLTSIFDAAPSPANAPVYAEIVCEHEVRRNVIQSCSQISSMAMDKAPVEEIMSRANTLADIGLPDESTGYDGRGSSDKMVLDLERRFQLNGALSGLDTGFHRLNEICEGLQFGEQAIIGARPSMGKTAIGLDIFYHNVFEREQPSLFISLEMSVAGLMRRNLSKFSNIPLKEIRRGSYTQEQFARFQLFHQRASRAPMYIIDGTGGMSITEIEYQVRRYVRLHGVKLVVIDYLQKAKASIKHEKRTYEIGDVSERLKGLAVETNAAFLTLAQLNREPDKDKGRMPRLNDLADCGQIERDGDLIGLLHRDKLDASQFCGLIVAKQRDGELGMVPLEFDGEHCCFRNRSVIDPVDVPTYLPPAATEQIEQELPYADDNN